MKECLFTFHRYKVLIRNNKIYRRLGGGLGANRNNLLHFIDFYVLFYIISIHIMTTRKKTFDEGEDEEFA